MKFIKIAFLFCSTWVFSQQGGMWIPSLLNGKNENEMKALGMKISAKDIYNINASSLKDAVPQFDGGCTAEMISEKGLLLTNHHCGFEQIQKHSSLKNNYIAEGFWAKSLEEELPNPGVSVTFVVRIEDVTSQVLKNTENQSVSERQKTIQKNISDIEKFSKKENWQRNEVKSFYQGNQYLLFVYEDFKDVRLVGAPPTSIGKFGSDTDNWVWPRHTGDFTLFRVYADKNNRPAEYSKENIPYKPKHFFPISIKGIKENDFTMVFGYPGKTAEYLPSIAVEQIIKNLNRTKIEIRDIALKIQERYMKADPNIKIQYASKNARIANYWKKWKGESLGLTKANVVEIKKKQEAIFLEKVKKSGKKEYETVLSDLKKLYEEYEFYAQTNGIFSEIVLQNTEILGVAFSLNRFADEQKAGKYTDENELLNNLKNEYKNYNLNVDKEIFTALIQYYKENMPKEILPEKLKNNVNYNELASSIFEKSALVSFEKVAQLLSEKTDLYQKIKNDPAVIFVSQMANLYLSEIHPKYISLRNQIDALQQQYMKGILEFSSPNDRIFPDANSTLRVTYGKVKGYSPSDAVYYKHITYLDGMLEKYIPNDYEFDLPKHLIHLYNKKDYGRYADKNGKMPFCFIGTNHTTGGNSGSPVIDAHGNLIGLNFDRVWEGTMSDIYYDPSISRNIMLDTRYILFIIDKYAGAKHLIDELKIVK